MKLLPTCALIAIKALTRKSNAIGIGSKPDACWNQKIRRTLSQNHYIICQTNQLFDARTMKLTVCDDDGIISNSKFFTFRLLEFNANSKRSTNKWLYHIPRAQTKPMQKTRTHTITMCGETRIPEKWNQLFKHTNLSVSKRRKDEEQTHYDLEEQ